MVNWKMNWTEIQKWYYENGFFDAAKNIDLIVSAGHINFIRLEIGRVK